MYPMTNAVLLQSSIIHGLFLLAVLAVTYEKLPMWIIVGVVLVLITSCWNHGTTSQYAMWCDQGITTIITVIILFVLLTTKIPYGEYIGYGIILAAVLWLLSYQYTNKIRNRLHLAAHAISTISVAAFLFMVYNLHNSPFPRQ